MRRYLIVALIPFFLYACSIDGVVDIDDRDDFRVEESETESFSAAQIRDVEVKTKNGFIESSSWDDDSIHFTFEKWATGYDREDAEDNLDDIKIRIDEDRSSGVLSIDVDYPNFEGVNRGCNVSLSLPSSIFLDLETSNGAITVSESQDGLECTTSNGAITIQDTEGDAILRTSNGRILAKNHRGDLNGRTSNGEIDADIVLPRHGECILKTSNGRLALSIPRTTSAMIEASTSNGKIEVSNLDVIITRMGKTELEGRIGNGEGNIDLETSNGSILIQRRS